MDEHPSGWRLELIAVVAAARERIFELLTDPVQVARWWGPHGFATACEIDLRVGGAYRFTMQPPDGDAFHLSGEFIEIDRPVRLVYTFRWEEPHPDDRETVVMLSLASTGNATELSLSQGDFATEDRLTLHRNGWTDSFEKLRRLLEPA